MELVARTATMQDLSAIKVVIQRAIDQLQCDFLTPQQVAASHQVMGLDTQLLRDGTYFMLLDGQTVAGCGGWSYRKTLFGGDSSIVEREPEKLNPALDAARIRAMYTDPAYVRRGIGRTMLQLCEKAAASASFIRVEMMATLAGEPLYTSCGYRRLEEPIHALAGDVSVPLVRMGKSL